MAMQGTLMSLAVSAFLIKLAIAANYTVGAPGGGWDQTTNLQNWASSQSFSVGDNLIFQYASNHDVLEVSKTNYDSCQGNTPLQTHSDGNTVITLSSPGKRYFMCGTAGHCNQGMKVEIDTLATSATPTASPSTPTPASSVTPVSSPAPETLTPSPDSAPAKTPSTPHKSSVSSPSPPSPSSANKDSFKISLTTGSILLMMLLAF
ncbi:Cu_bind_like domain-containing protein [Cephalotus follicularis]|uniref:Cu_bind_like domain-containing protein n=1 Tax=Cephalotus follicularis TaxID=3775 RepID=A0A1Q3CI76_CEPFO|nr:Cu_bind_like domain-containing protein [Cephalotus follicularis]